MVTRFVCVNDRRSDAHVSLPPMLLFSYGTCTSISFVFDGDMLTTCPSFVFDAGIPTFVLARLLGIYSDNRQITSRQVQPTRKPYYLSTDCSLPSFMTPPCPHRHPTNDCSTQGSPIRRSEYGGDPI